jgi:dihydrofolate reductase
MDSVMTEQMGHPFDLLLGRKTYEIFARYWPTSKEPGADALNRAKKFVASRTLKNLTWENSMLLTVTIGVGKRLFGAGTFPASFKLIESKFSPTSVIVATYVRDGNIKIG